MNLFDLIIAKYKYESKPFSLRLANRYNKQGKLLRHRLIDI